jgi:hypothetical protein
MSNVDYGEMFNPPSDWRDGFEPQAGDRVLLNNGMTLEITGVRFLLDAHYRVIYNNGMVSVPYFKTGELSFDFGRTMRNTPENDLRINTVWRPVK